MSTKCKLPQKDISRIRKILACTLMLCVLSLAACDFSGSKEPDDNYRICYEIFVRSFADGNGDGIGDLVGAAQKITYIGDLGATAVWLMPVMPSDTYHKYDVKDYKAVDPEYGTVDDFKNFVDKCHENGIRVYIDMPVNHTSDEHPWFKAACDFLKNNPGGQSKYVSYYNFSDKKESGDYYPVEGTPYFYEGMFWEKMPDLDLSCSALREELNGVFDFWLDLGVDGFRMDAACHFRDDDDEFNKKTLNEIYEYCRAKNPQFYMVSEVWEAEPVIAGYYGSKTPSMFNFDLAGPEGKIIKAAKGLYSAENLAKAMMGYESDFAQENPDYIDAAFVTNHDMGRVANALSSDEDAVKFAGGLNLIMRGSAFIYYGEEIGMKSKGTKDENKRLAMQWGDEGFMCGNPPGADEGIEQTFGSVKSQEENPDSIYNYYKNAIAIRRANPAIARGKTDILVTANDGNAAVIKRSLGDDTNIIAINTGEACEVSLDGIDAASLEIAGTMLVDNSAEVKYENSVLKMPAKSIVVFTQAGR